MSEAVQLARTTFPAEPPRRVSRVLVGFIALSLLAHGLVFFLFQVVYPPAVAVAPPTPSVSLLMPDTPEQEAFLRWIAAEDPASVASSFAAAPPLTTSQRYQPSYATLRTAPRTLPLEEPAHILAPTFRSFEPAEAPPHPSSSPVRTVATSITLGGALAEGQITLAGSLRLNAASALPAASYLIAVDERGHVRFAIPKESSTDTLADLAGSRALLAATIHPAPPKLTWGLATIVWGTDAYVPTPASPAP